MCACVYAGQQHAPGAPGGRLGRERVVGAGRAGGGGEEGPTVCRHWLNVIEWHSMNVGCFLPVWWSSFLVDPPSLSRALTLFPHFPPLSHALSLLPQRTFEVSFLVTARALSVSLSLSRPRAV